MAEINIRRKHSMSREKARAAAEHMVRELKEEMDLDYAWDGDALRFQRSGVSGELVLEHQEAVLSIKLGFLLSALKPSIESAVHKYFDENFQA